jgi:hypothetical protein
VVAVLAAAAVALEIWYNLSQQLSPDQLERARALWRERGPADYDLEYVLTRQGREGDRYLARVRDARVTAVEVNGQPLEPALYPLHDLPPLFEEVDAALEGRPGGDAEVDYTAPARGSATMLVHVRRGAVVRVFRNNQPLDPTGFGYCTMPGLFDAVGRRLELDTQPGAARMYRVAAFDPADGHLLRYVRSLTWPRERVEIVVSRFERVEKAGSP